MMLRAEVSVQLQLQGGAAAEEEDEVSESDVAEGPSSIF
jgi:hypothetical protein